MHWYLVCVVTSDALCRDNLTKDLNKRLLHLPFHPFVMNDITQTKIITLEDLNVDFGYIFEALER